MDANQTGGGLAFANALGVAFSQSQIRGGAMGGSNVDIFSTVTLLLNGNTLSAEPGDSSVNIGDSTTGQNVQYISQMAGTTMINSPTMVNGNLVLPHQYNFSMNPEQSATLPTATINANINVGTTTLNPAITLYPTTFDVASGDAVFTTPSFGVSGSNVSIVTSTIATIAQTVTNTASTITNTALTTFTASAKNTAITAVSSLTISSLSSITEYTGVLGVTAYKQNIYTSNLYDNYAGYINLTADQGANLGATPEINIISQNGIQGKVTIKATSGFYGTAAGGLVDISAQGGNNPLVGLGGTLLLQAFSGGYGSFGGLTSRVAVNGANVSLSAGAISGPPGLAGSMNIFGEGLVSIVSAIFPPVYPQIPQSIYCYANGGIRLESPLGVQSLSPFYAGTIYPLANGSNPLIIRGRSLPSAGVQIMDCEKINMVLPNGQITGVSSINYLSLNNPNDISGLSTINGQPLTSYAGDPHLWSYYNQLSTLSSITADNGSVSSLYVSSLNGTPFAPWYNVPAAGPVSMNQNSINNASYIITSNFYTTELNGQYSGVDMGKLTMKASTLSVIASTISMLNLSSVNGQTYIPTQSWSTTPATTGVDLGGHNLQDVNSAFVNTLTATGGLSVTNSNVPINFGNNNLAGVSTINGQPVGASAITASISSLTVSSISSGASAKVFFTSSVDLGFNTLSNIGNTFIGAHLYADTDVWTPRIRGNRFTGDLTIDPDGYLSLFSASGIELIGLSSINGAPYTGGTAWNGTATTNLNMANFSILNATNIYATGTVYTNALSNTATITTGNVNATGNINSPLYNGTNMNLSGTITTPGVSMSPTNVTIGGPIRTTTLDGGGLFADGITTNYVTTSNINTPTINSIPVFSYYPPNYFPSYTDSGQISFTNPGQYFISATPNNNLLTIYMNVVTGVTTTGHYICTNRNTNTGASMTMALQVYVNDTAYAVSNNSVGPGNSIAFDVINGRAGALVYANITGQFRGVPELFV